MKCSGWLAAAALLAACNASDDAVAQDGTKVAVADVPFAVVPVADFDEPWAIAFLPDGRALVTEKKGGVKLWAPGGATLDIAGAPQVGYGGQGGMLDIAPAPGFTRNRHVYMSYAEAGEGGTGLALARARLVEAAGTARFEDFEVLWRQLPRGNGGQFGAIIAFSPDGKSLFLASGERQRFTPAQDPDQALGKILRLTLDGKPAPGNPFAGKPGAATVTLTDPPKDSEIAKSTPGRQVAAASPNRTPAETWSSGHRNPYGLAFDEEGRLWEHEMGPKGGDELNLIVRGRNYGWPIVSDGDNYDGVAIVRHFARPDLAAPVLSWNPAISPAGMIIYSGKRWPQWKGDALIGALSGKALVRVDLTGATARKAEQWDMGTRIRDVAEAPDGTLYLLEDGGRGAAGRLLRLDSRP